MRDAGWQAVRCEGKQCEACGAVLPRVVRCGGLVCGVGVWFCMPCEGAQCQGVWGCMVGCEMWYSLVRATSYHRLMLPAPAASMFSAALANKCVKFTMKKHGANVSISEVIIYMSQVWHLKCLLCFLSGGLGCLIAVSSQRYLHAVVR